MSVARLRCTIAGRVRETLVGVGKTSSPISSRQDCLPRFFPPSAHTFLPRYHVMRKSKSDTLAQHLQSTRFHNTTTNLALYTTYNSSAYSSGPLSVSFGGYDTTSSAAFVASCPSINIPIVRDLNDGTGIGVRQGTVSVTGKEGGFERSCAYNAYYKPIKHRSNLLVRTGATVSKIELVTGADGVTKPESVLFFDQLTATWQSVSAAKEAILAAGAIQSPQQLMLSGVGPRDVLEAAGVQVVLENENVGKK